MMWLFKAGFIVSCFVYLTINAAPPSPLKKCQPKNNHCLAQAIESAIQYFANGSREMGVVPIEPLSISSMIIPAGPSVVNVEQIYRNVKLSGPSHGKVISANYNEKDLTLKFVQKLQSNMVMQGDYELKGKILLLPVRGKGPFRIVLVKPMQTSTLKFKENQKHGKKYLEVTDFNIRLDPQRIIFSFDNLFDGNKQLSDVLIKTVNDAWDVVYEDVRGGYEGSFSEIFKSVANQLFSRVPKNDLF